MGVVVTGNNTHARSAQKKGSYRSSPHKLTVRESRPCKVVKGNPSPPGGLKVDFIKPQDPLVSSKKYLQTGVGVL